MAAASKIFLLCLLLAWASIGLSPALYAQIRDPLRQWKDHSQAASRAFADGDLDKAESLLRKSLEFARQAGIVDERLIHTECNLAEVLISEGRYADVGTGKLLDNCVKRIKQNKLEDTSLYLRVLQLQDAVVNGKERRIANKKNKAEVTASVYGADSIQHLNALIDLMDVENLSGEVFLAEKTGMRILQMLHEQRRENDEIRVAVAARLGHVLFNEFLSGQKTLDKAAEILDEAIAWARDHKVKKKIELYRCYRYKVFVEYHRDVNGKDMEQAALFLIREVPRDSAWPEPELQAMVGSAYHTLADRYCSSDAPLSVKYAREAVRFLAAAPLDSWARGHVYWARCTLASGLLKLGLTKEYAHVLASCRPTDQNAPDINCQISDVLSHWAKKYADAHDYAQAEQYYGIIIDGFKPAHPPPEYRVRYQNILAAAQTNLAACRKKSKMAGIK